MHPEKKAKGEDEAKRAMLDAYVIEEIKRRERQRERDERPALDLPLPAPSAPSEDRSRDDDDRKDDRGVVIIDYSG